MLTITMGHQNFLEVEIQGRRANPSTVNLSYISVLAGVRFLQQNLAGSPMRVWGVEYAGETRNLLEYLGLFSP